MEWNEIVIMMKELNAVSVLLRLLLAIVCGGIVGYERERKGRPAGFRTYILVCTGAVLIMMTNQYIFQTFGVSDPARMGAQVVSGIGFLGAGTIIVTPRNQVKGLTTAAGLWACACMGLAIGVGFYLGALLGVLFIFVIIIGFDHIMKRSADKTKPLNVYIEFHPEGRISHFFRFVIDKGMRIDDLDIIEKKKSGRGRMAATAIISTDHPREHGETIEILKELSDIAYIHEII